MKDERLKPCPFCGGEAEISIHDDEGNFKNESYEFDPWSGLTFAIKHTEGDNPNCIIATYEGENFGTLLYTTKEELIEAWNRRI